MALTQAAVAAAATHQQQQPDASEALRQQVSDLTAACASLRDQVSAHQAALHEQQAAAAAAAESDSLRRRLEASDLALQSMQRAHGEAVERAVVLQQEHQRVLDRLAEDHAIRLAEVRSRAEQEMDSRWRDKTESVRSSLRLECAAPSVGLRMGAAESGAGASPTAAATSSRCPLCLCLQAERQAREAQVRVLQLESELESLRGLSGSWRPEAKEFLELEHRQVSSSTHPLSICQQLGVSKRFRKQSRHRRCCCYPSAVHRRRSRVEGPRLVTPRGWISQPPFRSLLGRIGQMERSGREKEERWRQVLEEARRVHQLQQSLLR